MIEKNSPVSGYLFKVAYVPLLRNLCLYLEDLHLLVVLFVTKISNLSLCDKSLMAWDLQHSATTVLFLAVL